MPSERGYSYIGIIGVVNLSLLTLIVSVIFRYVRSVSKLTDLHLLLIEYLAYCTIRDERGLQKWAQLL